MERLKLKNASEGGEKAKEKLRDEIFDQLIASHVLDAFEDDLSDAHFPDAIIQEIIDTFSELSEHDKRAVLAIPAQLRPKVFSRYMQRVEVEHMTGAEIIQDVLSNAHKNGFTLGFHLSPNDIRPGKDGDWSVKGTEKDHRHDDHLMAYYSMDYSHRYLKKPSRFLYVIRAETADGTSHYQDNDDSWGHASNLAIVHALDLKDIERELAQKVTDIVERYKTKEGDVGTSPSVNPASHADDIQASLQNPPDLNEH